MSALFLEPDITIPLWSEYSHSPAFQRGSPLPFFFPPSPIVQTGTTRFSETVSSENRGATMKETEDRSALQFFPAEIDYPHLKEAAAGCMGCDLYKNATQTVFGEGTDRSELMFIGEQPGDEEDLTGRPFVGPAGRLFDKALEEAGIDRSLAYVTNTVKHFKWKPQGKRRIHEKPKASEITACLPWVTAEIELVKPRVLALLGATAAQALLGKDFRVTKQRGIWLETELVPKVIATVHPSSILRAPDPEMLELQYAAFVEDLRTIAKELGGKASSARARGK
jgi:uracil-DNA glycosylase